MIVKINTRPLSDITAEDLRMVAILEGCCPQSIFWDQPIVFHFANVPSDDFATISYYSTRLVDAKKSSPYHLYFNMQDMTFFCMKSDILIVARKMIKPNTLVYLMKRGYKTQMFCLN